MKRIIDEKKWDIDIYDDFLEYCRSLRLGTSAYFFASSKQWREYNHLLQDLHLRLILSEYTEFHGMEKYRDRIEQLRKCSVDSILEMIFEILCIPSHLRELVIKVYKGRRPKYIIGVYSQRMLPEKRKRLKEVCREIKSLESNHDMSFGEKDIRRNYLNAEMKAIKEGGNYTRFMPTKTNDRMFKEFFEYDIGKILGNYYSTRIYNKKNLNKNCRQLIKRALNCGVKLSIINNFSNDRDQEKMNDIIRDTESKVGMDLGLVLNDENSTINFLKNEEDYTKNSVGCERSDINILYVHGGLIKCLRDKHDVKSIKAIVKSSKGIFSINANCCRQCQVFFISYDELMYYHSVYGPIFAHFRWVNANGEFSNEFDYHIQPSRSPLFLCGYNVDAQLDLKRKERQLILKEIIDYGILEKYEIINYLSYFIKRNGKIESHELAKEKWSEDLAFVRSYKLEEQDEVVINKAQQMRK